MSGLLAKQQQLVLGLKGRVMGLADQGSVYAYLAGCIMTDTTVSRPDNKTPSFDIVCVSFDIVCVEPLWSARWWSVSS